MYLTLYRVGYLSNRFSGFEGVADSLGPEKVSSLWDQGDRRSKSPVSFRHPEDLFVAGLRVHAS